MPVDRRKALRIGVAVVAIVVVLGLWWWASQPSGDGAEGASSRSTASQQATPRSGADSSPAPRDTSGLSSIQVAELPREARRTLDLITAGGPYPYSRDGIVFQNRERLLPRKAGGYYHEYTVPTPGENDRGARRIIIGKAGERYWTNDHYASFRTIQDGDR